MRQTGSNPYSPAQGSQKRLTKTLFLVRAARSTIPQPLLASEGTAERVGTLGHEATGFAS